VAETGLVFNFLVAINRRRRLYAANHIG